jgi:hypothetical protein
MLDPLGASCRAVASAKEEASREGWLKNYIVTTVPVSYSPLGVGRFLTIVPLPLVGLERQTIATVSCSLLFSVRER